MAIRPTNAAGQFGISQFIVDPVVGQAPFQTISAALAASVSGDTIYVRPGIYTESLISNMSGKSIIGAAVGTNAFEVQIVGNHVFDTDASTCAFQSVGFSAAAGAAWTVGSSGAGNSSLYLEGCQVNNSGGIGVQVTSAGGTGSLQSFFTAITGSTVGIDAADGTMRLESSTVTGGAAEAMNIGSNMIATVTNMTFSALAGNAVVLSSVSSTLHSELSTYEALLAAFHFTAGGFVRSITDSVSSANPVGLFADSTGAFGSLSYAAMVLLGVAKSIDAQITATALSVISASGLVTQSILGSQTLESNHRYFVLAGALSLLLPAMSNPGDEIQIALRGGVSWTITQGVGQIIYIGSTNTSIGAGGSLASTAQGDYINLVCSVANSEWLASGAVGNITVN